MLSEHREYKICRRCQRKNSPSSFEKLFAGRCARASDKCIVNCRCEVLNAVVVRGGASRDGGREEDGNEVERRLSEGRRAISSRPPMLEF